MRFPDGDLYSTLNDTEVCNSCRNDYYTYCDDCGGYYHDEDADNHNHDSDNGCCESPQLNFAIRNDGCEPLANDTQVTVTLPAGIISVEGLKAIKYYLYGKEGYYDLSWDLETLGDKWQTRDGNYTKRLSRHAYKNHGVKIDPVILSQVGCIAREHSTAVDITIDVTRDLNQRPGYFYHEDSCYWGGYSTSRCALKTNGGFGLRSLDSNGDCSGRAWVLPLRQDGNGRLNPTFDTATPDAFVVFNGYGGLGGYVPARIMSHMAGWTYRKIDFSCSSMYINAWRLPDRAGRTRGEVHGRKSLAVRFSARAPLRGRKDTCQRIRTERPHHLDRAGSHAGAV